MLQKFNNDEMGGLLVGTEPCTFVKVRDDLSSCVSVGLLWTKLLDVARSLEISADVVVSLKNRLSPVGTVTYPTALYEILEAWRSEKGENAKLNTLIKTLRTNGLSDSADTLRASFEVLDDEFFAQKLKTFKSWNAMPQYIKSWTMKKIILFQGNNIDLEQLMLQTTTQVDMKILKEIAEGEIPCIVKTQIPKKLEFYVSRTVTSRDRLELDVLKHRSNDIFVVEGIEKHKLSSLVPNNETTDVSENQVKRLTVRFILLRHNPDFEQICKIAFPRPVHWIKYINGNFELVESSGSVENLQRYIADSQDSFPEAELASSGRRLCLIADSPGMGKTSLLENIAHQIIEENSKNMFTGFIVLKDFVKAMAKKKISPASIVKVIAARSSEYEFGKRFVANALKTAQCVLIFDGFDEVLSNQVSRAKKILQAAMNLRAVRIFVATRHHFRNELEHALHVLGFTIQPFNEANQVDFLLKYWKVKGAIQNDALNEFAKSYVKELTSKMRDSKRNIAGIPLQCKMLAETYEVEAIRCSEKGYNTKVQTHSMFGMYEAHMEMRFRKICMTGSLIERFQSLFSRRKLTQYESIKQAHIYYALKFQFPEHAMKFNFLNAHSIPLNELCGLGLLEPTHSNDIRFVHHTFAEFLIAEFVYKREFKSPASIEFVLSTIFKVTPKAVYLYHPFGSRIEIDAFEFTFPVICYFINGFAKKDNSNNFPTESFLKKVFPICMAASYHDLDQIPSTLTHYNHYINTEKKCNEKTSINHLLLITAEYTEDKLMYDICSSKDVDIGSLEFVNIDASYNSEAFIITPLHVAVRRGHYHLVEYLLKAFGSKVSKLRYLIHFCVYDSLSNSKEIVDDKIEIIKLLNMESMQWLDEKLPDQTTPLMQRLVNLKLLECLIEQGADVNVCDRKGETVLDKIFEKKDIVGKSFHQFVETLNKRGFKHFKKPNQKREILLKAMRVMDLLPETLEFLSTDQNINAVDFKGDSVLFSAINLQRSVELIIELIRLGACWKHRNRERQNVIHISVLSGNFAAVKYLSQNHSLELDINAQDSKRNTPLHYAMLKWSTDEESIQLLIKAGANVNAVNEKNKTPFILAFEQGDGLSFRSLRKLEDHGFNITSVDASKALKMAFLRFTKKLSWFEEHVEMLKYFIDKGGQVDFEFIHNFWEWEFVQDSMFALIKSTKITSGLLAAAQARGILTKKDCIGLERLNEYVKGQQHEFYKIIQKKTFEHVYLIFIQNHQKVALQQFRYCLSRAQDKLTSSLFLTPHPGLKQLILSGKPQLIALVTNNIELSCRRIQDTTHKYTVILEDINTPIKILDDQVVLKCDVVTAELISKLMNRFSKVICVCREVKDNVENCERLTDEHNWKDISSFCIDKLCFRIHGNLYNIPELFTTPKILEEIGAHTTEFQKMNDDDYNVYIFTEFKLGHGKEKYLSEKLFHHPLPDKLVFLNIGENELRDIAKFDPRIGRLSEEIESLDYIVLQETQQFEEVCNATSATLHLIDHHEGRFKLIMSTGSNENVKRYLESTNLCCDFPFCNCNASDEIIAKFSYLLEGKEQLSSCQMSIHEFLPQALRLMGVESHIDLFRLRKLFNNVRQQSEELLSINALSIKSIQSESPQIEDQLIGIWDELKKYLRCSLLDMTQLKKVAAITLFPQMLDNCKFPGLEKYVNAEFLEYNNGLLVFKNQSLAWYFLAKYILEQQPINLISLEVMTDKIFLNCFESYTYCVPHCSEYIQSFKFINHRVFKYLDSIASKNNATLSHLIAKYITSDSVSNWIHACVNDNFFNLLRLIAGLQINREIFASQDFVVLAVTHAHVPATQLITQMYEEKASKKVKDIILEFNQNSFKHSKNISIFHVAVLIGNYSVVEYLLQHYFKETISQPEMYEVLQKNEENCTPLHLAILNRSNIMQLKLIRLLISKGADVNVNATDYSHVTPLHFTVMQKPLSPQVIEIINLLLENGANADARDELGRTFLHWAPYFFTPQLYHQLLSSFDDSRLKSCITKPDSQNWSHLHHVVYNFEPPKATLEIFKSNDTDFKAQTNENESIVLSAIEGGRNAEILKILFEFGADCDWRIANKKQENASHIAAMFGNLSALKLFIELGCDVNLKNIHGHTPMHNAFLGVRNSEPTLTNHDIVAELLNHRADLTIRDNEGQLPIDLVYRRVKNGYGYVESRTVELLQTFSLNK